MKDFPGKIRKAAHGRMVLDDGQLEWLRKWYPSVENERLAMAMGVGKSKLYCLACEYKLSKSESGMRAIKRRQVKAMVKTNTKNGCYDRKRGHPPSEATLEGSRRRWREFHEGKRESTFGALKRRSPKRYEEAIRKLSASRKELIRKEQLRADYGLERKTRLNMIVVYPYTRSQIHHRNYALKRGYLLDEDCSEGTEGRYVIYYDAETDRSEKFERNCKADGFSFVGI